MLQIRPKSHTVLALAWLISLPCWSQVAGPELPAYVTRSVIDGPFAETRELIAGYSLIQVKSREEAMEWARRFPNPAGRGKPAEIEVRPLYELDDFAPSPEIERMRDIF